MRRISQFVSFALALLMLVPAASLVMVCNARVEQQVCSKRCCEGMAGMDMPMSDQAMSAGNEVQLSHPACCIVTETDSALPATPASRQKVELVAVVYVVAHLLATALPEGRTHARIFSSGFAFREPTPSRLCTFLI
jgi:hypothetical protein